MVRLKPSHLHLWHSVYTKYVCLLSFMTPLIVIHISSLMALLNSRNHIRKIGQDESYSLSLDAPLKCRRGVSPSVLTL